MEFNYREVLPAAFDGSSRVWIYQSNRKFTEQEGFQINEMLHAFVSSWNSHGTPVKGFANLFYSYFVILMADEQASAVSGCSTDSSVHLIREMEKTFSVRLFDRQLLAFYINGNFQLLPLVQLASGFTRGMIHPESLYFNNTVLTKNEMFNNWIIPVKDR